MELLLATNNRHKYIELRELLPPSVKLYSLSDFNIPIKEIIENGKTFEENALIKARTVAKFVHTIPIIADDSGLEVFSLNGEPGIYSARYAGDKATDNQNVEKLLHKLENIDNRKAQFKCCIAFIDNNKEFLFEGIVKGSITRNKKGKHGFGYDPVFVPDGYSQTFAEMPLTIKNTISHRAIAIKNLIQFLEENSYITKPIIYNHSKGKTEIHFGYFTNYISKINSHKNVFIIDKNVYKLHNELLAHNDIPKFILTSSEQKKSLHTVEKIYDFFYQHKVDRNTNIIVVGGGISTDIGAFVASTWKRGCRLTLVPTTTLAMIDAAIGGKTAVNFMQTKNLIGTFYHPDTILIDTNFLKTLPYKFKKDAIAEILKHAIGFDKLYFEKLFEKTNFEISQEEIKKNIEIKLNIVLQDAEEKNIRKLLNLGHTVGHAIETTYSLSHGKAILIGLLFELKVFEKLNILTNKNIIQKLLSLYKQYKINYLTHKISYYEIISNLFQDKKISDDSITLPVLKEIGKSELIEIKKDDFTDALKEVIHETYKG